MRTAAKDRGLQQPRVVPMPAVPELGTGGAQATENLHEVRDIFNALALIFGRSLGGHFGIQHEPKLPTGCLGNRLLESR